MTKDQTQIGIIETQIQDLNKAKMNSRLYLKCIELNQHQMNNPLCLKSKTSHIIFIYSIIAVG